jgi:hypothetical protein
MPPIVNYCNASDVNPTAGQNITLWANASGGRYPIDTVWFEPEYHQSSYNDRGLYAYEYVMPNNQSEMRLNCCANSSRGITGCTRGPIITLNSKCYKNFQNGGIIRAILCMFEDAWSFGGAS